MATALAEAHIAAQARLRELAVQTVLATWDGLGAYDAANVAPWLQVVVPLVAGAQRQSAALTNAFLARALGRPPAPVNLAAVTGAAIRAGTPPAIVYRRPFVTVWTGLRDGTPWTEAVNAGRARAGASAAMDVQNTMRHTLLTIGSADKEILGFARVPDADACDFCRLVAGKRYLTSTLMEVHPRCGCGVDVITAANRGDFTGKPSHDLEISSGPVTAKVVQHGELGALLVDGHDHFTGPDEIH